MARTSLARCAHFALLSATALTAISAQAENAPPQASAAATAPLEQQFQDPPGSARPRVWWHWMNGNITKEGIARDLDWMHRMGIGGLQNFDANLATPQIVPHRLVYMTPEWKDAFRFAAMEADRLGLELGISSSPGWSETGGPWVEPRDGLKKVTWSETVIAAGKRFFGKLAPPPTMTGPFQSLPPAPTIEELMGVGKSKPAPAFPGDIAVLAVPDSAPADRTARFSLAGGGSLDGASLADSDLTTGITVPSGSAAEPTTVLISYDRPRIIRSLTMFLPGTKSMYAGATVAPVLEASADGTTWHRVAEVPVSEVEVTISFPAVTASQFRLVLNPLTPTMSNMGAAAPGIDTAVLQSMAGPPNTGWQLRELKLSAEPKVDQFEVKAGFATTLDYYALGDPGDG